MVIAVQDKYVDCCGSCGEKRYKIIREMGAITISMGTCKLCKKKEVGIVPERDWRFACRGGGDWD